MVLFEDIDKYVSVFLDSNPAAKKIALEIVKDYENTSNLETMHRVKTAMLLLRYRFGDTDLFCDENFKENFSAEYEKCLIDVPSKHNNMHENIEKALTLPSALMMNPDPYVGDAYLLIIVQEYLRQYHEGGKVDKKLVWDSCIYLF